MNIYAELVWNADEGMYTGKLSSDNKPQQFLISTPGVYKFDRVFIADTSTENPNDGSEIIYSKNSIKKYPLTVIMTLL